MTQHTVCDIPESVYEMATSHENDLPNNGRDSARETSFRCPSACRRATSTSRSGAITWWTHLHTIVSHLTGSCTQGTSLTVIQWPLNGRPLSPSPSHSLLSFHSPLNDHRWIRSVAHSEVLMAFPHRLIEETPMMMLMMMHCTV